MMNGSSNGRERFSTRQRVVQTKRSVGLEKWAAVTPSMGKKTQYFFAGGLGSLPNK